MKEKRTEKRFFPFSSISVTKQSEEKTETKINIRYIINIQAVSCFLIIETIEKKVNISENQLCVT
jgi:hypothetical protein